jgi:glycosyltransferase involved in cell wall biosynthesis
VDPFIARRADATVVTFHDMIPEWLDKQSPSKGSDHLPAQKAGTLRLADAVLTVSEATRRDLEHFHPGARGKATVTPLATCLGEIAPAPLPDFIPGHFFLFVGNNRESYKNGMTLLRAMALLADRFSQTGVIFFGGPAFTGDENEWLQKHHLENRVWHVSGEDPLLAACYRKAVALVYPSSYEGFGLPVLEAMQLGCPVITSPNSSLPEVAGEAAVYVDPHDPAALAGAMTRMLMDKSWRGLLVNKGFSRSAHFSWSKTAGQTVSVYRVAVERKAVRV